ncbi:MAG: hypothetical protein KBT04_03780 [Bacteroidales bacterium]|nr:hypothetical protein [Candidatus Colimorpha onthohippi]
MKDTKLNYTLNVVARYFVGLVLLFSSFVKAVDPMGTAFKIQEYFSAWSGSLISFQGLDSLAPLFSMVLIAAEFLVAVLMLTGAFRSFSAWLFAALMVFFTVSTALDAFSTTYGINDCGCFGDAVKLTPKQTFFKNVILDIPMVWIVLTRNIRRKRRFERDCIITIAALLAVVFFELYNINNEPCIDFRAWKVGREMMNTDPSLKAETFVVYREKATGAEREFSNKELMSAYNSNPDFDSQWEWVSSRVIDPHEIHADGFSMLDIDGNDHAVDFIGSADPVMIITAHHLDEVNDRGVEAIRQVMQYASENNIYTVMLTAALPETVTDFLTLHQLTELEYYLADDKAIETMTRSNPGFVLIENAVVKGKWHYRKVDALVK